MTENTPEAGKDGIASWGWDGEQLTLNGCIIMDAVSTSAIRRGGEARRGEA